MTDEATLDASWKMLLALRSSRAEAKNNELPKNTDKDAIDENVEKMQSRISTLENNWKKSKGDNY